MTRQFLLVFLLIGTLLPVVPNDTSAQDKVMNQDEDVFRFLETQKLPEDTSGRLLVISSIAERLPADYLPPLKLGKSYLHFVEGTGKNVINGILFSDPNAQIIFDRKIDFFRNEFAEGPRLSSFVAKDLLGIEQAWDSYNVSGKGVTLGITDSGVDFGHSDLSDSPKLLNTGITASFDPTGFGAAPTSLTLRPTVVSGETVLPLEGQNLTVNLGEEGGTALSSDLGITLENLVISNMASRSISGNFKVGMMYQPGEIRQVFLFVLVDTQQAGIYDELWVDMSTSLGLSLALNGIIFEVGRLYRELVDWSLVNEEPYGPSNPVIAKDVNGDGYNDVSMGALATVLDLGGLVNGGYIRGIDPEGRGIGVIYDAIGHGTQVTSAAAGRGYVPIQIYDNFTTTDEVENSTVYHLPGSAPNASVIVTKGLQITDFLIGWFWLAGLEPVISETGGWTVNEEHRADISSNSWGDGSIGQELKGMDTLSFILDALSTPDIFSQIDFGVSYPNYPGLIFFVASGNGGPGFGTVASPGAAAAAITVGASTSFHTQRNSGKNDVALFSSNGPTPLGIVKPDILALGSFGFTDRVLILGSGNGTRAAGEFGGTSEATPRAAGIGALLIEALKSQGITATLNEVKVRLKSTAKDLSFPSNMQGGGLINAFYAISTVFDDNYLLVQDTESQILLGNELSTSFESIFGVAHPFTSGTFMDASIYGYRETFLSGRTIKIVSSNGSIPQVQPPSTVDLVLISETLLEFTTSLSSEGVYPLSSIPNEIITSDFMVISIGLTNESYQNLQNAGLTPPTMNLIDLETGRIIDESFSTGYAQQLYSGKPSDDFSSTPAIVLVDPGFQANVPFWSGLTFEVRVSGFSREENSKFEIAQTGTTFNLSATTLPPAYLIEMLEIEQPFGSVFLPVVLLDINQAGYGSKADYLGDEIPKGVFYQQNATYGAFNWFGSTARPEAGDYRFYTLEVPTNATFLAIQMSWTQANLVPNLYLYDSEGKLVAQSETEYIGGGFYQSKTSEPFAQNLIVEASSDRYYLISHFVETPFGAGPYQFKLLARYLTLTEIPSPETTFSEDISLPISGQLNVSATNYTVSEFPELKIDQTNVQIFKGKNGTIEDSLSNDVLTDDPFTPEYFVPLELEAGEKGIIGLFWFNDLIDLDLYLFPADQTGLLANDVLARQGTTPGAVNETAAFSVDRTTTYLVMVDFAGGEIPSQDINFVITYDTRRGPSFTNQSDSITIDTTVFENDEFGIWIQYSTNFDILFNELFTGTFVNHQNFTSTLLSPSPGQVVNGVVNVTWESNVDTQAFVYLEKDGVSIFLGSSTSRSFIFDSTLYKNGDYNLQVRITDGVFVHEYSILLVLQNNVFSSLSPIPSETSSQPIPFPMIAFFTLLFVTSVRFWRKSEKEKV